MFILQIKYCFPLTAYYFLKLKQGIYLIWLRDGTVKISKQMIRINKK